MDRQIEPLVMGSEISGLDDRHAYLKLGNLVARFDFDYLDLPTPTPGFIPRQSPDGELSFDPDTLKPRRPSAQTVSTVTTAEPTSGSGVPLAHKREMEKESPEQEIQSDKPPVTGTPISPTELDPASDLQDQIDLHDSLGGNQHAVHSGIF